MAPPKALNDQGEPKARAWEGHAGRRRRGAGFAGETIEHAADPGTIARKAYTYCPVLIGGPLLFMVGGLLAKLAVFERWAMPRMIGVVALAGLWFVVPMTTPLGLAAMTTGAMGAVPAWETAAGARAASSSYFAGLRSCLVWKKRTTRMSVARRA